MKKFTRFYVEITNVCNLTCSFCVGNVRTPRFMSVDEFRQVLEQVKLVTDYIYLHVLGEPLLHPELEEILAISHQEGMKVNITTNGTLLRKMQEVLLRSPALRKVSVSLHSMEEGSQFSPEEYAKDVVGFANSAGEQGVFCDLRLWNLGTGDNEKVGIFDSIGKAFGFDDTKMQEIKSEMGKCGNVTLVPNVFLGKADRFRWPSMDEIPTQDGVFCYGLRNQAAVLCDGSVVPCCLDSRGDILLGNIFEQPLEDILLGDRAKRLYDGFSARKPSEDLCRRCGYATRF